MAAVKSFIFSLFVVLLIVIGVLDVVVNREDNKCDMTWMYQQPEFLRVSLSRNVNNKFPNYGLHVYGEGNYARQLDSMKMTGVPVLFIPGNAGSYKQVRSLGSVAFRRAIDKQKRYHFNFFSVNLNEEFSGLYGAHLKDQTEFVHLALKKIFSLYKGAEVKPKTIILVGHSMGGMVARGLFTLPKFDAQSVNTIFMQAVPNQSPVLTLDRDLADYHDQVNTYWRNHGNSSLNHVTLVSSGGGDLDIQVRGGITLLDGIVDENHSISTSTIHTPLAWVSTDHRCIVWCKQVVMTFVKALFDIVDEKSHMVSDDVEHRMSVFRHHFLQHPGSIGHVTSWPGEITLDDKIAWTLMSKQVWKWHMDEVKSMTYLAMPVVEFENVDKAIVVSNVPADSWICVCELRLGQKQCSTCTDVSSTGNVLPPRGSNKKVVQIDLNEDSMARVTHVVVVVPPTKTMVEVIGELYAQEIKHLSNSVPGVMEILMSYPESFTKGAMVLDLGQGSSFYKLKLFNLNNVVKVYTARLETSKCREDNSGEHSGSVVRYHVPWSNEDTYQHIKYGTSGNVTLRVQYVPPAPVISADNMMDFPFVPPGQNYDSVELFLHLDPTCSYKLRLTASFKEILGQFVRFYAVLMPVFCVANLLIALTYQMRALARDGVCPSLVDSIGQIKPYVVVPFALLTQFLLQTKTMSGLVQQLGIPIPDTVGLEQQGIWFRGAQLFFYLLAMAITQFQATVVSLIIEFNSRLLGLVFGWLPSSISGLLKLLSVFYTIAAVGIAATMCGSVGIIATHILGFIQVIRLNYLSRQITDGTMKSSMKSKYNFFLTVFMLWMWLMILNGPPIITWFKSSMDIQSPVFLVRDPSKIIGTVAAASYLCLQVCNTPMSARSIFKGLSYVIHILVIQMLVFGMVTLYRISYVIVVSMAIIAVSQVLSEVKTKVLPRPKTE